jgi:hypothetical protein
MRHSAYRLVKLLENAQQFMDASDLKLVRHGNKIMIIDEKEYTETPLKIEFNDKNDIQFDMPIY